MRLVNFTGLRPKLDPTKLEYAEATKAVNCDFYSTTIEPTRQHVLRRGLVDKNGAPFEGVCLTLVNVGGVWVGFDKVTYWADDYRGCDCGDSIVYVDEGRLWRLSSTSLSNKQTPSLVGVYPPCSPPSTALTTGGYVPPQIDNPKVPNVDCAVDDVDPPCDEFKKATQIRSYYVTYVNECGEESAPSPAAVPIQVAEGQAVTLTDTAEMPSNAVARRWYVYTPAGTDGQAKGYYLGETIGDTFTDTMDPLYYQDIPINTLHWLPPIQCLEGVASIGDRLIVAWHGSYMYFSEVAMPHAFKRSNVYQIPHVIKVIKGFVTRAETAGHYVGAILTDGRPYTIRGSLPDRMNIVQFAFEQPYISGYVEGEGAVYYNSPNALCRVSAEGFDLLTDGVLTEREYGRYVDPTVCIGYGTQQIFSSLGMSFVVSSASKARTVFTLSTHSTEGVTAFCTDKSGTLFFTKGDQLYSWQDSSLPQTYIWRSKEQVMDVPSVYTTVKLVADIPDRDSVKVRVWGDGEIIFEEEFKRSGVQRIARHRCTNFMVEVEGRANIKELHLQVTLPDLSLEGGMQ